ncbi:ABC transporter permease [Thermobrachium celere]|uniref:Macrolide export ATP-binding/permease protein MacB n=2 Tax=Thermobrachium TaxID=150333 RepID=R7RMU2_9CLOT|nr:ABC transporter permease [Thermobrachium celere]CDF57492.1 Macrolide export ATP-binding/permease protein MacB [Thermobrachium celere DSM 8682]
MRRLILFKMAFSSIASNKIRTFLTMLGIIIGISSVITLVGLGEGTKKKVQEQIESLGTNLITVNITSRRTNGLSDEDIELIKTKPGIKNVAPLLNQNGIIVKSGTKTYSTTVEASTPEYFGIRKLEVESGRKLEKDDIESRRTVSIIGQDIVTELFPLQNPIGQSINIQGVDFTIVGVLKSQGSSVGGSGDDRVIIPITTAKRLFKTDEVRTIFIEGTSRDDTQLARGYLELYFNNRFKGDTSQYRVFDQTSLLETATKTTESMTLMLMGIAAISLLVGGIGIMNIMLVAVIERTREIGIRKALGAKRRDIMIQFLIESSTVSLMGGILGIILGYLLANFFKSMLNMSVYISLNVVLFAVAFSIFVGIFFGIYPASRASKLNPIDALRYE